ncbi:hypothetical protein [Saccharopolyspora sp. NPDC002376]
MQSISDIGGVRPMGADAYSSTARISSQAALSNRRVVLGCRHDVRIDGCGCWRT